MSYNEFDVLLNQANHYYNIGRYEQTLKVIENLLSIKPNNDNILYLKSNCHYHIDQNQEAINCCKEALANGGDLCDCNYLLGRIYLHTDRFYEAEECFLSALREDSQRADIMAAYGFLMLKTAYNKKAENLIKEALRIDPENETVLHYEFYFHLVKSNSESKINALERYIKSSSNEVRNQIKIGLLEFYNCNYKIARECFRQAFLLDPTNNDLLTILQSIEEKAHPLFFVQRFIEKIGGGGVIWISVMVLLIMLQSFKFTKSSIIIASIYIVICVYTWISPLIYKVIVRINKI